MTLGHLPSGYILAYLIHDKLGLKLSEELLHKFMFFWMLGAVFPDVDTLPYLASGAGLSTHRQFISHTPFLYALVTLVVLGFGWTLSRKSRQRLYVLWGAFFGGVLLHFAGDSIFYGVRWLYPFSDKYFGLFPNVRVHVSGLGELFSKYLLTVYFIPDFVSLLLAWWVFFEKGFGRSRMWRPWR